MCQHWKRCLFISLLFSESSESATCTNLRDPLLFFDFSKRSIPGSSNGSCGHVFNVQVGLRLDDRTSRQALQLFRDSKPLLLANVGTIGTGTVISQTWSFSFCLLHGYGYFLGIVESVPAFTLHNFVCVEFFLPSSLIKCSKCVHFVILLGLGPQ